MKRLAIVLIAVACKKDTAPVQNVPEPVVASPRDAAPADAPPQSTDLLHAVPVRLAVSSIVANAAYSPFDLVDGDVATAWNSRTGDMKAWIAFRMPPSTHVERVRLTVGFTGKGPEGDYFTMNKLAGPVLSIDKDRGKPDDEAAKSLGRHRLQY